MMSRVAVIVALLLVATSASPSQGRHYREILADLQRECAEFFNQQAFILAKAGAITDTREMLGLARACFKPHTRIGRKVETEARELVFCETHPTYSKCR